MNKFDEWFDSYEFNIHPGTIDEAFEDAFITGMLAAADIAELAKDYILPADDLADVIAMQIRNYANAPSNERP